MRVHTPINIDEDFVSDLQAPHFECRRFDGIPFDIGNPLTGSRRRDLQLAQNCPCENQSGVFAKIKHYRHIASINDRRKNRGISQNPHRNRRACNKRYRQRRQHHSDQMPHLQVLIAELSRGWDHAMRSTARRLVRRKNQPYRPVCEINDSFFQREVQAPFPDDIDEPQGLPFQAELTLARRFEIPQEGGQAGREGGRVSVPVSVEVASRNGGQRLASQMAKPAARRIPRRRFARPG